MIELCTTARENERPLRCLLLRHILGLLLHFSNLNKIDLSCQEKQMHRLEQVLRNFKIHEQLYAITYTT